MSLDLDPAVCDICHMTQALHFNRIEAAQNMARFYVLALQPTLFGEVTLLRYWGRIGTQGQSLMQTFATTPEAAQARLVRMKQRRCYVAQ